MAYCSKGKVCITLKKISQLTSPVVIDPTENFDLSEALESIYPLLEIVFSYLDYNDLKTAAKVKESWRLAAGKVLKKRDEVSWVTVFRKKRQSHVHCSSNYPYNNISLGMIFFNYRAVSLSDCFCCHENYIQRKIKFSEFLSEQVAPFGTNYCVIGCAGLGSMFSQKVVSKSSVPLFDCCFLPEIQNVKTSMFYCNPGDVGDIPIDTNAKLKCLLLFCKSIVVDNIYTILEHFLPKNDFQSIALGGGIIRRTMAYPLEQNKNNRRFSNLCIAFYEDIHCESVCDTSSLVISNNHAWSSENFEMELVKFKKRIIRRTHSIAFRICCSAKMKKSHELKVFNKVFPNTPLLGMEAEGEIGWDYVNICGNDEVKSNISKKAKCYPEVLHQWTTVIVFITWGQVLNKQEDN